MIATIQNPSQYISTTNVKPALLKKQTISQLADAILQLYGSIYIKTVLTHIKDAALISALKDRISLLQVSDTILATHTIGTAFKTHVVQIKHTNPTILWKTLLNIINFHPMPYEQGYYVHKREQTARHILTQEWLKHQRNLVETSTLHLFNLIDGTEVDQKNITPAASQSLDDFLLSHAAFIQGNAFCSWYEALSIYTTYNPQVKTKVEQIKPQGAQYIDMGKFQIPASIPPQLSCRKFIGYFTAFILANYLEVSFSESQASALVQLFMKDETARRQALFFTQHPHFTSLENLPNDTDAEVFLERVQIFLKLKKALNTDKNTLQYLYDWIFASELLPSELVELVSSPENFIALFQITATISKELNIPQQQCCTTLIRLSKVSNYNDMHRCFKETLPNQAGLWNAQFFNDFLSAYSGSKTQLNYANIQTAFKQIYDWVTKIPQTEPPSADFWLQIIGIPLAAVQNLNTLEPFFLNSQVNHDGEFYPFILRFLKNEISKELIELVIMLYQHLQTASNMNTICAVLANCLKNPHLLPLEPALLANVEGFCETLKERYNLSNVDIGILFCEFIRLSEQQIEQQKANLAALEELAQVPLSAKDVYEWLLYHPDPEAVATILSSLEYVRDTIPSQIEEFLLSDALIQLYVTSQQDLTTLQAVPASRHTSTHFLQTVASLSQLLSNQICPLNPQIVSDFCSAEAMYPNPDLNNQTMARTSMHTYALRSVLPNYHHAFWWRGWEIPSKETFPTFVLHRIDAANMATQTVRVQLKTTLDNLKADPQNFKFFQTMCQYLCSENYKRDALANEATEWRRYLPLFPTFQEDLALIDPTVQTSMGSIFFEFVKELKIALRKLVAGKPQQPLQKRNLFPFQGNVYLRGSMLSLVPPNAIMDSNQVQTLSIDNKNNAVLEQLLNWMKDQRESFTGTLNGFTYNITYQFDPLQINDQTRLNQLTLTIKNISYIVRYFDLLKNNKIILMLRWHVLMTIEKFVRHSNLQK